MLEVKLLCYCNASICLTIIVEYLMLFETLSFPFPNLFSLSLPSANQSYSSLKLVGVILGSAALEHKRAWIGGRDR